MYINKKKLEVLRKILDKTQLSDIEKNSILSIPSYFSGEIEDIFTTKTYILDGDSGVGKTFIVERLLDCLNIPILYCGSVNLGKKARKFKLIGIWQY